jgi:hypothetical protein
MRSILEGGPAIMTAAAVVLLAAACSADGAPPAVVVRDSAGVRITEIAVSLGEARSRWSISSEPILDIGVEHGDAAYEFDGIASAGRLTDGTIAIANSGSGQIRVFDAEGRYLRSMGGLGQGPGEFNRIAWMQIGSSDTVLVIDPELRRVTAFGSGGELAWIARIDGTGYACPATSACRTALSSSCPRRVMSGTASGRAAYDLAAPIVTPPSSFATPPKALSSTRSVAFPAMKKP